MMSAWHRPGWSPSCVGKITFIRYILACVFDANDFPATGNHGREVRVTIVNIDGRRINFWQS